MKNRIDSRQRRLRGLRTFLLLFLFHFFMVQPVINVFYPKLAERVLKVQSLEENEEEEESNVSRLLEEEVLHSLRFFYSFVQAIIMSDNPSLTPYINKFYSWTLAEVNTPPPEV